MKAPGSKTPKAKKPKGRKPRTKAQGKALVAPAPPDTSRQAEPPDEPTSGSTGSYTQEDDGVWDEGPPPTAEPPEPPPPVDPLNELPREPRGVGRPTVFERDPTVWPRFISSVRAGNTLDTSYRYAGIAKQTFYNLVKQGKEDRRSDDPVRRRSFAAGFLDQLEQAMAQAEVFHVRMITEAARQGAWKASAFILAARNPKQWSPPSRVAHVDKSFKGNPVFRMRFPPTHRERMAAAQNAEKTGETRAS